MKKIHVFISALAVGLASITAHAQNPAVYPLEYGESVLPLTAVKVAVTVEKETVLPGPYARYAQKFLGAMAPLSPRVTYDITGASLQITEFSFDGAVAAPGSDVTVLPNVYAPTDFVKFAIDRTSLAEKSAEAMAQDAANTIYTLRRRRFDLISGEAGEHVYGAGMKAALDELARMEEEYVSLFMGKSYTETSTEVIEVVPEAGKTNYTVCRFSPEEGLLPDSDLGAAPVVLTLAPEQTVAAVPRSDKKTGSLVRIARWTDCRVMDGTRQLAARRLPIFQFGETVLAK
ncbi:MAG: DUF4831 family protein [Rikenellaceae bacterium]|nr:DUF4831 family protein [Rikenellaceae bacterium]